MSPEYSEMRMVAEIGDLNRGFLALLTRSGARRMAPGLGLQTAIVDQLRQLTDAERDQMARTPGLLACLAPPNQSAGLRVADQVRPFAVELNFWIDAARLYAIGLLTWLSRIDDRQMPWAALCLGGEAAGRDTIQGFDFARISDSAEWAAGRLRARFTGHASFWPDLIHGVRSNNADLQMLSRLKMIPYALAEQCPAE